LHTAVWADPAEVLPESVIAMMEALSSERRNALSEALGDDLVKESERIDAFAELADDSVESKFAHTWMPPQALAHVVRENSESLKREVALTDIRRLLDAYLTLDDYLDDAPEAD